ncbi:hypothetical protein AALO_G00050600 [Alosa alosa]|uniref:Uncharacterized protein n=1 Tax=Alosa alosa TaxID=278164 RepID=A0AAV6H3U8_9TELE|nr:hypothetical protein AALO_G00050600 [Alosa alosa]
MSWNIPGHFNSDFAQLIINHSAIQCEDLTQCSHPSSPLFQAMGYSLANHNETVLHYICGLSHTVNSILHYIPGHKMLPMPFLEVLWPDIETLKKMGAHQMTPMTPSPQLLTVLSSIQVSELCNQLA